MPAGAGADCVVPSNSMQPNAISKTTIVQLSGFMTVSLKQAVTSLTAVCHPWHAPNHPWGAKTLHLVFIELLALPTPREKARHRLSNIHRTPTVNPASGPPPLASWALRINLLFVLSPFFAEKFPVMR